MIIESRFKIDRCCATDGLRQILEYVNVMQFEGVDVAVAANGYMMAIVPVTMEPGDLPGLVHGDLFRYARKHDYGEVGLTLDAEFVRFGNGWRAPRFNGDPPAKPFPDIGKVIDLARKSEPAAPNVALNPSLLKTLCKAIGAEHSGVVITQSHPEGPLLISDIQSDAPYIPPFGILMPMMTAPWASKKAWHQLEPVT